MRCEEVRELAADVALGIADGEQRAEVLRHISTCGECRRFVEELSEVTDELLMLAPVQEPPAGFESRVVERLVSRAPRHRPARRFVLRVAPALAAAAVTAVALVAVYHDDHVTAARYRATLEEAGGQSFRAAPLYGPTGERAGVAFGYEGSPSWVFVTVDPAHRGEVSTAELVTKDKRSIRLPWFDLNSDGTWGAGIPLKLSEVASIRLLGKRPGQVLEASVSRQAATAGSSDR
jgi:putative zinc finger protein